MNLWECYFVILGTLQAPDVLYLVKYNMAPRYNRNDPLSEANWCLDFFFCHADLYEFLPFEKVDFFGILAELR